MAAQPLPERSQRSHAYPKALGEFAQLPRSAESRSPCCASPWTLGRERFCGAGDDALAIRAVGVERRAAVLAGPFAITSTRSVRPTSPDEGRYTRARTEVSSQAPPATEQRRHWYEKRIGVLPVHVPFVAASRPPATG